MDLLVAPDGGAEWGARRFRCALGRGGVTGDKREGDGATPAGAWALVRVLYRPDRMAPPDTALPLAALSPADGWCDAPDDSSYNRQVQLPHDASCEALWRDDHVYDLIVVTDHNDAPVRPYRGSAIFLHVAKPGYAPTEGCVAFALDDLRLILNGWRPEDRVRIAAR
jgi:L,D-peptidoglycan transpeptidase YkuD (ErfK/YbiS/YcfS/YnhG family)